MFECLILVCLSKLNRQGLRDEWWYIPDKIMGEGSKHCESKGKTSWNIPPSCFLQISAMEEQPTPTWLFLFPEGTRLSPDKLKVTIDQILFWTLRQAPSFLPCSLIYWTLTRPPKRLLPAEDSPCFTTTSSPGFFIQHKFLDKPISFHFLKCNINF